MNPGGIGTSLTQQLCTGWRPLLDCTEPSRNKGGNGAGSGHARLWKASVTFTGRRLIGCVTTREQTACVKELRPLCRHPCSCKCLYFSHKKQHFPTEDAAMRSAPGSRAKSTRPLCVQESMAPHRTNDTKSRGMNHTSVPVTYPYATL